MCSQDRSWIHNDRVVLAWYTTVAAVPAHWQTSNAPKESFHISISGASLGLGTSSSSSGNSSSSSSSTTNFVTAAELSYDVIPIKHSCCIYLPKPL